MYPSLFIEYFKVLNCSRRCNHGYVTIFDIVKNYGQMQYDWYNHNYSYSAILKSL